MRTGTLRIEATSATRAIVHWSTTVPFSNVVPVLPAGCQAAPPDAPAFTLECRDGLAGGVVGARNLGEIVNEATVFVRFADGRTAAHLLTPTAPSWQLPTTQSAVDVGRSYVRAGLVHIARPARTTSCFSFSSSSSFGDARAVLLAETAFTLSHSLSFSATALGLFHVRAAPAEACNRAQPRAARARRARQRADAQVARRGALVALVFGLVHGLGFAGGLSETGLPDQHVAVALVGFGLGVELGQVAFLVLVLVVVRYAARLRSFPRIATSSAVAIGGLASAWFVERLLIALA